MKFKFKIQQYQTEAVDATVNVFAGQPSKTNAQYRRDLGKRGGKIIFDEESELLVGEPILIMEVGNSLFTISEVLDFVFY